MSRRKMHDQEVPQEPSFMQQLGMLPEVMQRRFLGQITAAAIIAILTLFLLFYFRTWQYCIGLLIALYIAYLAMDLVWNYHNGKIECRTMICVKSQHLIRQGRVFVIMRDVESTESTMNNTKQFYIATNKKNAALITPQTVMTVYYRPDNPLEIVAWEIVGNNGST